MAVGIATPSLLVGERTRLAVELHDTLSQNLTGIALAVNAIRHGNATEIRIAGSIEENRVLFSLRDNGCGFDPSHIPGIEEGPRMTKAAQRVP